jgi:hypothetical protein
MKPYYVAQLNTNVGTWVEVSDQLHVLAALPSVYVLYVFKRRLLCALDVAFRY